MDDQELVAAFEAATLPGEQFSHVEHVRVAWWYASHYPLADAIARIRTGLQRFAAANGAPQRYHETITVAYMLLIAARVRNGPRRTWSEFIATYPELVQREPPLLGRHYEPSTLSSERARLAFVWPDREALPAAGCEW